ncbi:MAG TPA: helix-turn-helix domain-containing protein [Acidimicrobiales bacterium]
MAVAGEHPEDRLEALASLAERTRRAVYAHVAAAGDWVSRDQVADALALGRGTAAHHLDRLAADGLLDVEYRRLSGRRGPGAGRPAKLYRRAGRDVAVSLPPRDYELAGALLAAAADRARTEGVAIDRALDEAARAEGRAVAAEVRRRLAATGHEPGGGSRAALVAVLEDRGFEPRTGPDGTVMLRNCPFHRLARRHTELVCGMNLALLEAAVDGVGDTGLAARLEPEEGVCCVRLRPAG